ncbi:MAG TPA: hypothetical protein VK386_09985, partial [Acidimicrobiales bacterium]|nr:hypothetical protein [Acidimicrobiales bacterium]
MIAVLVAILTSACSTSTPTKSLPPGATAPTTTSSESTSAHCANAGQFTALSVTRSNPSPDGMTFIFPDHVTSTDRSAIVAVANSACQLPVFPSGPISCPADFG